MCYFNGKHAKILDIDYTSIEDAYNVLNKKGFCFIKQCLKMPLPFQRYANTDTACVNKIQEFYHDSIEHKNLNKFFRSSKIFNFLQKQGEIFVSSIDLRIFKNSTATFLHHDLDVFLNPIFDEDIYTIWTPLTNTTFNTGTLAIVGKVENFYNYKNIIKEEAKNEDCINAFYDNYEVSKRFKVTKYKDYKDEEVKSKMKFFQIENTFFAKELNIGDVAIFKKDVLHCALDTIEGIRASLDFRIAIIPENKKKIFLNFV